MEQQDRSLLRELAKRKAALAARPCEQEKARLWTASNDLHPVRPMVFIDPENGWNEILTPTDLQCADPCARGWEFELRRQIYQAEVLLDDRVIDRFFDVPVVFSKTGWGLPVQHHGGEGNGAYIVEPSLVDYERDFEKLRFPEFTVDEEASSALLGLAQDTFGDILDVRQKTGWWWTLGMTWSYIDLRGLENFLVDMLTQPEWVHKTMAFLRDGTMRMLDFLEARHLLPDNTGNTYVGSGGFGYTEQLPAPGFRPDAVRTKDMWGFCESQETSSVSPDMFAEFVLPYQIPILERFGLNCYGCCEPLDTRWKYVKAIPRLRRISISPWANRQTCAEAMGKDYILSMKISPTPLASPQMDEEIVRQNIREALSVSKGLSVELIMKDNHTLGGNPRNASRWVEIAREEIVNLG